VTQLKQVVKVPKNKLTNAATVNQTATPYAALTPAVPELLTCDLIAPKITKSMMRVTRTMSQAMEAMSAEKRNPSRFESAATRKAKNVTPAQPLIVSVFFQERRRNRDEPVAIGCKMRAPVSLSNDVDEYAIPVVSWMIEVMGYPTVRGKQ
jgi:phospholipase C